MPEIASPNSNTNRDSTPIFSSFLSFWFPIRISELGPVHTGGTAVAGRPVASGSIASLQ